MISKIETIKKINLRAWNTDSKKFIREVQKKQKKITLKNPAENWFSMKIKNDLSKFTFSRQKKMGFRVFDFWCKKIRVAIEIDGKQHNRQWDLLRDQKYQERFHLKVYRIWAFNESDYKEVLKNLLNKN